MYKISYLCFCSDINDGWYQLTGPDNTVTTWDFPKDIKEYVDSKGWGIIWEQANSWSDNSQYMPEFMKGN